MDMLILRLKIKRYGTSILGIGSMACQFEKNSHAQTVLRKLQYRIGSIGENKLISKVIGVQKLKP